MKYPIKRCFALLAAMAAGSLTAAALPAETASAAEQSSLLIMGDSIASGYGLKNDEMSYADYLREFTGGTVTNLATLLSSIIFFSNSNSAYKVLQDYHQLNDRFNLLLIRV